MTGVIFPDSMSSRMILRSSLLIFAINVTNFWLTNRDKTGAVSARVRKSQSPFAPATTHTPLGFKARLCADNECSECKKGNQGQPARSEERRVGKECRSRREREE